MVSESEIPLDEVEDEVLDDIEEPSDSTDEDDVASLKNEIAALRAQVERPSWLNELKTIEGRVRSAEARLQNAEDPRQRAALRTELEAKLDQSNALIQAMINGLDETAFTDPATKQRAQEYIGQQQQALREADLIQRVRGEIQNDQRQYAAQQQPTSDWSPEVKVWERTRVKQIQKAGLDPDSADFAPVWKTAAASLANGDFDTADDVIDAHLSSLIQERSNAMQRTDAKNKAKGSPSAAGGTKGALDPSRSSSDRIAYLRSIGAI